MEKTGGAGSLLPILLTLIQQLWTQKKAKLYIAEAQQIVMAQDTQSIGHQHNIVDKCAIRATTIAKLIDALYVENFGMAARDRTVLNVYRSVGSSPDKLPLALLAKLHLRH